MVWSAMFDFDLAKAVTGVNLGLTAVVAVAAIAARRLVRGRARLRVIDNDMDV
jgi:hypothetical protein